MGRDMELIDKQKLLEDSRDLYEAWDWKLIAESLESGYEQGAVKELADSCLKLIYALHSTQEEIAHFQRQRDGWRTEWEKTKELLDATKARAVQAEQEREAWHMEATELQRVLQPIQADRLRMIEEGNVLHRDIREILEDAITILEGSGFTTNAGDAHVRSHIINAARSIIAKLTQE